MNPVIDWITSAMGLHIIYVLGIITAAIAVSVYFVTRKPQTRAGDPSRPFRAPIPRYGTFIPNHPNHIPDSAYDRALALTFLRAERRRSSTAWERYGDGWMRRYPELADDCDPDLIADKVNHEPPRTVLQGAMQAVDAMDVPEFLRRGQQAVERMPTPAEAVKAGVDFQTFPATGKWTKPSIDAEKAADDVKSWDSLGTKTDNIIERSIVQGQIEQKIEADEVMQGPLDPADPYGLRALAREEPAETPQAAAISRLFEIASLLGGVPLKNIVRSESRIGSDGPILMTEPAWYNGMKQGRFPRPIRSADRTPGQLTKPALWAPNDIVKLIVAGTVRTTWTVPPSK